MNIKWEIVTSEQRFVEITKNITLPIALDCETKGTDPTEPDTALLGISIASNQLNAVDAIYVPLWHYEHHSLDKPPCLERQPALMWAAFLGNTLKTWQLIGHNFTYDKKWIDHLFKIDSNWVADTRIMWHLSAAPAGPHPYGLKQAQKEVLGWADSNEKELEQQVKAKGGSLKQGGHYLADLVVLAKYAALDAYSTYKIWERLQNFFNERDYWSFMSRIMTYNRLLAKNTALGLPLNTERLKGALASILEAKDKASITVRAICGKEITELEDEWKDKKQARFKIDRCRDEFLNNPAEWDKFNPSSDVHLAKLYYDKLQFPVTTRTAGGKPKVDKANLKLFTHTTTPAILEYNKQEKLAGFAKNYLKGVRNDKLHCSFNICGTVSGRLSGFTPNIQQAPFKERAIMECFECLPGYIGIHSDLSGIEPCITAHYSDDPTLLKVYRDGIGDIYLDLAKELFPLQLKEYNPDVPLKAADKGRYAKERDICKTIHLALQYTGTQYTVARNLTLNGFPTTPQEAYRYVRMYWNTFKKVREFNLALQAVNKADGYVINVCGRIIRVPNPDYKDLPNRFIQSSAHDVLMLWVLEIDNLCRQTQLNMLPWVIDIHDSTTWQVKEEDFDKANEIFTMALRRVNTQLNLSVAVRADIKQIRTLADIKRD